MALNCYILLDASTALVALLAISQLAVAAAVFGFLLVLPGCVTLLLAC
jgi:hypothetical protein